METITKKNIKGFTLLELIVAVSLFALVIVAIAGIFQANMRSQRASLATQALQENMSYVLELISKEIRMAQYDDSNCGSGAASQGRVYSVSASNDELYFKNSSGDCVKYELELNEGVNKFKVTRGASSGYMTPSEIDIKDLDFRIIDSSHAGQDQALVNLRFEIEISGAGLKDLSSVLQTTISSRYYE